MAELCLMEAAAPFDGKPVRRVAVLVGGDRCLEIARIGKAVGADRAAVGKYEFGAVILAQIPARRVAEGLYFAIMPRGTIAIWPGSTCIRPISVKISIPPFSARSAFRRRH